MKKIFGLLIIIFFVASCSSNREAKIPEFSYDPLAGKLVYPIQVTNYGIAGFWRADPEFQFKKMEEAGLQIVRREITWRDIEKTPGNFDFSKYDQVVNLALSHRLKFLGILAYGNWWASEEGREFHSYDANFFPPDNLEDFGNYVTMTVSHFKGRIKMWEVWNEPNGGYRFWKSSLTGDPEKYGDLLKVAYTRVKKVCPECTVSYAGLFYHQEVIEGAPLYLEKSFEYHPDLGNYFDVMAYHPYPFYPPLAAPESDQFLETPIYDMNYNMLNILKINGYTKPLWITEVGWPTIYSLSLTDQANYLVRSFVLAYATGASMYLYFTFWDGDLSKALVPPEAKFGLFNYPYSTTDYESLAKPGWFAYKTVVKILGGKWTSGECNRVKFDPAGQYSLKFTSSTEEICVVWQLAGKNKLHFIGKSPDEVLDIYGNKKTTACISPSPLYLIWNKLDQK